MSRPEIWGSDGPVSLPQPLPTTDTDMAEMDGFCFTPDGLRPRLSLADREELLANAFRPEPKGDQA